MTIVSIFTALSLTISLIAIAITDVFEKETLLHSELSLSKGDEALKKRLNKLGDFVKRLARKVVESFSANVGNAFDVTLSLLLANLLDLLLKIHWF